jgi:hypothetical protein
MAGFLKSKDASGDACPGSPILQVLKPVIESLGSDEISHGVM